LIRNIFKLFLFLVVCETQIDKANSLCGKCELILLATVPKLGQYSLVV